MPKLPAGKFPKYARHKASGQAVVTINGRDYYLGPHGTKASHAAYDRLIAEWLANGRPSGDDKSTDLTIAELAEAYLRHAEGYYVKNGRQTSTVGMVKLALRPLVNLYADALAIDFGPSNLKAIQQSMALAGQSRSYCNQVTAIVKRLFKWAAAEELLPVSAYHTVAVTPSLKRGRSAAREPQPIGPVDHAAIDATLAKLPQTVADMVRLQRLTGMRPGEVFLMRPEDVDRTGDVWLYRPAEHKTEHHERGRIVAIGPNGQAILRPYLLRPADAYCFSPADSERKRRETRHAERKTPLAHGNRPGTNRKAKPRRTPRERYDRHSYRRAIERAADAAGVPRWSPNRLRHTFLTEARRRFGLETAQVLAGHAHAHTTEIYAERDLAKAIAAARQIG